MTVTIMPELFNQLAMDFEPGMFVKGRKLDRGLNNSVTF